MSLPSSFSSAETYFKHAVDFLHSYAWIYRESNTSCIKSLDEMPCDFKEYFLGLSNEDLNTFPLVHEPLDGCPQELHRFRQQAAHLTPTQTATTALPIKSRDVSNHSRKMAPKKLHEIEQLAANIYEHCAETTELIIDLGSGLGYLSEALFKLNNNYLILGLEADENRVQTARKRCQQLLPPETHNSIIYQQLFITSVENSRTQIMQYASQLGKGKELTTSSLNTTLIGLHACADLSISAMLLFLSMPQVRCLHIMPCCYHKLALNENGTFRNFPLSKELRLAMSNFEAAEVYFNRPFMRLACQQTNSRWQCDDREHKEHGSQMFMRALASALCDENEVIKVKRCKVQQTSLPTYQDVQRRYELQSQQTGEPLGWRSIHEKRLSEITGRYSDGQGARLAEGLCCLQTSIQQLCENVVLYDRQCYLKELAAVQEISLEVRCDKLFDEKLSPRCRVLIAKKL